MSGEIDWRCYSPDCDGRAVEVHWRIDHATNGTIFSVCVDHIQNSKDVDNGVYAGTRYRFLYLPIVQPVVGSEPAVCFEIAMDAAMRLLRLCNCDRADASGDVARADLALLRQAQAEAYERNRSKEAA